MSSAKAVSASSTRPVTSRWTARSRSRSTCLRPWPGGKAPIRCMCARSTGARSTPGCAARSEEHTSELQSQSNLVCRLLLEKKKKKQHNTQDHQPSTHSTTKHTNRQSPHKKIHATTRCQQQLASTQTRTAQQTLSRKVP